MKKKLGIGVLTLLLGILCAFGLVACGNHSPSGGGSPSSPTEFTQNGLVFDTVEDYYTGEIVTLVTGFKNNSDTVNIPAEVNGHPVVQINRGAFARSRLKQVTIPDSVVGTYQIKAGTKLIAEVCLMGIKGKMKPVSNSVSSCVISPRREHSRKPDEVRERIVDLFGDVPRIELFARQWAEGWDCWGNQCEEEKFEQNYMRRCA